MNLLRTIRGWKSQKITREAPLITLMAIMGWLWLIIAIAFMLSCAEQHTKDTADELYTLERQKYEEQFCKKVIEDSQSCRLSIACEVLVPYDGGWRRCAK